MKYVIWGAGQRGKKAMKIFGKDNILYYVDKDKQKIGKLIEGIEIKGVESIFNDDAEFLVVITPVEYGKQVVDYLRSRDKDNYLIFEDHPFGIDLSTEAESIDTTFDFQELDGKMAIYGISWFSMYLYDYFSKKGIETSLFYDEKNSNNLCKLVKKEYTLIQDIKKLEEVDYVLAPEAAKSVLGSKYIDINDYIERSYRIVNPTMLKYHNIHSGERCFIIATGPSLRISDLEKLNANADICISMNRIYNLFEKTQWRPDYYVIEDQKMIEDLAEEIAALDLKHKFVSSKPKAYWNLENSKSSIKYNMVMQNCLTDDVAFSKNAQYCVYNGYTVTYVCLQLAVYMGFSEIYLVGVDFNYASDIYAESNHFEGYQKHYKDIRLNPIMPDRMLRAYRKAYKIANELGINIYNATRGGKLEIFERRDLDVVLEGKK